MMKRNMLGGGVSFTKLFSVFIVIFGGISLLMFPMMSYNAIIFLILPIFGLALGLLRKPTKVNVIIRILLAICSIIAVGFLCLWSLVILMPTAYLFVSVSAYAPQVLLVVPIGCIAFVLLRKHIDFKAKRKILLSICSIVAAVYSCLWILTNLSSPILPNIAIWLLFDILPVVLLVASGYIAVTRFDQDIDA